MYPLLDHLRNATASDAMHISPIRLITTKKRKINRTPPDCIERKQQSLPEPAP